MWWIEEREGKLRRSRCLIISGIAHGLLIFGIGVYVTTQPASLPTGSPESLVMDLDLEGMDATPVQKGQGLIKKQDLIKKKITPPKKSFAAQPLGGRKKSAKNKKRVEKPLVQKASPKKSPPKKNPPKKKKLKAVSKPKDTTVSTEVFDSGDIPQKALARKLPSRETVSTKPLPQAQAQNFKAIEKPVEVDDKTDDKIEEVANTLDPVETVEDSATESEKKLDDPKVQLAEMEVDELDLESSSSSFENSPSEKPNPVPTDTKNLATGSSPTEAQMEKTSSTTPKAQPQPQPQPQPQEAQPQKIQAQEIKLARLKPAAPKNSPQTASSSGAGSAEKQADGGASGPFRNAELLSQLPGNKKPTYPEEDRLNGTEGRVILTAYVTQEGLLEQLRITQGSSPSLNDSAWQAFSKYRFKPGQEGWVRQVFNFKLVGEPQITEW